MKRFAPLPALLALTLLFAACAPTATNQLGENSTTYTLRERLFSQRDTVIIQNAAGDNVFRVDPPLISLGDSLVISSVQGNRLGRIDRRILTLNPTYILSVSGNEVAQISRDVGNALFQRVTGANTGDSYNITPSDGSAPYTIRGDIFGLNYRVSRNGQDVAVIFKPVASLTNRYFVEVAPGQNDVLVLEMVIALNELIQG